MEFCLQQKMLQLTTVFHLVNLKLKSWDQGSWEGKARRAHGRQELSWHVGNGQSQEAGAVQLLGGFGREQPSFSLGRGRAGPVTRANQVELTGMRPEGSSHHDRGQLWVWKRQPWQIRAGSQDEFPSQKWSVSSIRKASQQVTHLARTSHSSCGPLSR